MQGHAEVPHIAGVIPEAEQAMEPISPELVLVDPELARAARARLTESASVAAATRVETSTSVVEPAPPQALTEKVQQPRAPVRKPWHTRLSPVLLLISVFVNIVLISLAVSDARVDQPPSSSFGWPTEQEAPVVPPPSSRLAPRPGKKSAASGGASRENRTERTKKGRAEAPKETTIAAERRVLEVVVQSPAGKLPPALIDSRTGLAKNNLQAVCRRASGSRTFLCVVRPARHKPTEGLYVRYRPVRNGRGSFTWYPYRNQ